MSVIGTEEFIPAVGRNVVYGFRTAIAWEYDAESGQVVAKPGSLADLFTYRPAQIVRVWSTTMMKTVNLVVFLDGANDAEYGGSLTTLAIWKTSVIIGEEGILVEHYLPRVPDGTVDVPVALKSALPTTNPLDAAA